MTGVPQLREVKEALRRASTNGSLTNSDFDALTAAARRLVEVAETSQEVEWCEVHNHEGYDSIDGGWTCEDGLWLDGGWDCRIVSRRLVDPQLLPGDDDE